MKTIFLSILLLLTLKVFCQKKDSLYIIKHIMQNSDDLYLINKKFKLYNENNTKGIEIDPLILENANDKLEINQFTIKTTNIGKCHENDIIEFTFSDSTKASIVCGDEFNCTGKYIFYPFSNTDTWLKLRELTILNVKYTNGYSKETFSKQIKSDYFTQLFFVTNNRKIKLTK